MIIMKINERVYNGKLSELISNEGLFSIPESTDRPMFENKQPDVVIKWDLCI